MNHLSWHLARAGGIVAWALLGLATIWGLLLSTRVLKGRPTPAWLLDLHRFLGGLALVFTAVHVGGLVADSYVHFGPAEILVPFASGWRTGAVAWGVVGLYLLLAVQLTSMVMRRLPRRVWRAVHGSSFVLFLVAGLHGATAGTDASNALYRWASVAAVIAVVYLTLVRILAPRRRGPRVATPAVRRVADPVAPTRVA